MVCVSLTLIMHQQHMIIIVDFNTASATAVALNVASHRTNNSYDETGIVCKRLL
jgi:hypothetical protein